MRRKVIQPHTIHSEARQARARTSKERKRDDAQAASALAATWSEGIGLEHIDLNALFKFLHEHPNATAAELLEIVARAQTGRQSCN